MISGNYTAVVSNPYGRNSSTTIVQYKCEHVNEISSFFVSLHFNLHCDRYSI